jgi:hypothetical protein
MPMAELASLLGLRAGRAFPSTSGQADVFVAFSGFPPRRQRLAGPARTAPGAALPGGR